MEKSNYGKVKSFVSLDSSEVKILRESLKKGGISISSLAEEIDLSRNAIYIYFSGKPISTRLLVRIYRKLHCPSELKFIEKYLSPYELSFEERDIEGIKREIRLSAEKLEEIVEDSSPELREKIIEDLKVLTEKYSSSI